MSFINLSKFGIDFIINTNNVVGIPAIQEIRNDKQEILGYGVTLLTSGNIKLKDNVISPIQISYQDKSKDSVKEFIEYIIGGTSK